MIETRGLVALVEATDAMLKSANVELVGPITQVGNAMVTVCVSGDVAAVKAATEAGKVAAQSLGEIVSVSVIARPHNDLGAVLPKARYNDPRPSGRLRRRDEEEREDDGEQIPRRPAARHRFAGRDRVQTRLQHARRRGFPRRGRR